MVKIDWKKCTMCLFLLTGFMLGLFAGAMGLTVIVSYRIDKYHERINYLEMTIAEKDTKLQKLNDSLNRKKYVLKDIDIIPEGDIDEMVKISLQKHISDKLSSLIGKEISSIDTDLIEEVVNNRVMRLGDVQYRLKFSKMIVTEILRLWLQVETIN